MSLIPGAVRWDAFYMFDVNDQMCSAAQYIIGFPDYRQNAPWFSDEVSSLAVKCNAVQANMDLELQLAHQAGLKYWAYLMYSPRDTSCRMYAWRLHQSSSLQNLVNWVPIYTPSAFMGGNTFSNTSAWHATMASHITDAQQSFYQKVMANRPLLFILWDDSQVTNFFGNTTNFATVVTYLNSLCAAAGLGNFYIVVQQSSITSAKSNYQAIGAQAMGNYSLIPVSGYKSPYSDLATNVEAFWASQFASGGNMVPTAMAGWKPHARRNRPVPWEAGSQRPFENYFKVFDTPTTTEFTTHIQNIINFCNTNATACESGAFLIYSWSECDESSNPLVPSLGDPPVQTGPGITVPTSNLLKALQPVLTAVA